MTTIDIKASVQRQFNQVAANYSTSSVHARGRDLEAMVQAIPLTGQELVIDAGCGTGHTALAFAPHVAQVIAVDFTEGMLAQGRQLAADRGLTNVEFRVGDVEKLAFADGSVDLIVSRYSAHHWPHPAIALEGFRRMLKPGGSFILNDIVSYDATRTSRLSNCCATRPMCAIIGRANGSTPSVVPGSRCSKARLTGCAWHSPSGSPGWSHPRPT